MSELCRCLDEYSSREYYYKGLESRMSLVFEARRPVVSESVIKRKRRNEVREVMEARLRMSYKPL